ncbi:MAG: hypothetical protein E7448_01485 [Ruminococcaceae bacterium]|nr:hypothetical protein [Oscillospiraceae bacterium]
MFLTDNPAPITLGEAGVYALLGYAVVFFGLILLMLVVIAIGKCFIAADKKRKAQAEPVVVAPVEEVAAPTAPGAAGDLKLHNVEPKIAAMLMAIVADKLGKPLNELRFLSIREVEE